ncbi:hypothetical protein J6590_024403 [Homalodisca vitripennis]|nr:hypothetical protein J6590_024403 [Homalodisca vitripennis]
MFIHSNSEDIANFLFRESSSHEPASIIYWENMPLLYDRWVRRTGSARDKADNCGSAARDKADNYVYS